MASCSVHLFCGGGKSAIVGQRLLTAFRRRAVLSVVASRTNFGTSYRIIIFSCFGSHTIYQRATSFLANLYAFGVIWSLNERPCRARSRHQSRTAESKSIEFHNPGVQIPVGLG